ncbi:hypothetical protein EDB87DRAFT_1808995 [Lactarius vividus]|nr:hypothetical protein EDB87DRAFT_1808995 [Lactarius vividus]
MDAPGASSSRTRNSRSGISPDGRLTTRHARAYNAMSGYVIQPGDVFLIGRCSISGLFEFSRNGLIFSILKKSSRRPFFYRLHRPFFVFVLKMVLIEDLETGVNPVASEVNVGPERPEPQSNVEGRQVTAEKQRGDKTVTQSFAENYGDPSDKLWSMYLTESKKEDDQITKNWTKDTGEVLVFTGLFSVIVAVFITESYKKLSPSSGDQTVALLTQLVSTSAGGPAVVQSNPPFEVPASIVRVNVLWFLSLILSLSCALLATLMQQWARRYLHYTQHRAAPRKWARIRAYMFEGAEKFHLSQAAETIPLLLHTSVFLFFAGLIDFLLPINNTVALSALGCVVAFAFIYAILTLLPILHLNCPYHTPLSGTTYISLQLSALSLFSIAKAIEGMFHGLLLEIRRWFHTNLPGSPNVWPTKWRATLEDKVSLHYERFSRGLRWRVELRAMEAPTRVDANALHWTLTTLDEDKEFEDFASHIPGFLDSRAAPNATSAMLSLMSDQSTSEPILGARLRELLWTCLPGTSLLTEEQRTYRLRVCLMSLWYCVRAYNQSENSEVSLPPYLRAIFASPEVIRWIQTERDLTTRLLGRCFGSLVVKKLANDLISPTRTNFASITAQLACLSRILGTTGSQVEDWLNRAGAIDLANIISLTSSEMHTLVASGTKGVSLDVLDVFEQTLSILADGIFSRHTSVEWDTNDLPPDQVAQFHEIYSKFANAQVPDILKQRLRQISDRLPSGPSYVGEAKIEFPSPGPVSEVALSPATSRQSRRVQTQIGTVPDSGFSLRLPF